VRLSLQSQEGGAIFICRTDSRSAAMNSQRDGKTKFRLVTRYATLTRTATQHLQQFGYIHDDIAERNVQCNLMSMDVQWIEERRVHVGKQRVTKIIFFFYENVSILNRETVRPTKF
jgi:hypothetical protein